jgi:hypothetical protein
MGSGELAMSGGLYDDLVATPGAASSAAAAGGAAPTPASAPSLYADLAPQVPVAQKQSAPATAADRVQAAEGGLIKGAAYTAGLIPDTLLNLGSLGTAVSDAARHYIGGTDWADLPRPSNLSPVGHALTQLADKSPITTTQPVRPDDPASRYLNTGASVLPAIAAGGEASIPNLARSTATAVPPALAAQYVAEAKPFKSDAANNAATVLTQALGTAAMPRGRGAPIANQANDAVQAGQEAGFVFPPGATNPTAGNRLVSSIAGKSSLDQHASVENQPVTNEQARAAIGLKPGDGAPLSVTEIAEAKANAAPGYDAMRNAGQITAPPTMAAQLAAALKQQSGAGRLAPSLRNSQLDNLTAEIGSNKTFDAADAMDTIAELRDRSSAAYNQGDKSAGKAYKGVSNVIENAIDQHLSANGQPDVVQGFRNSRQQFAAINTVEENRNPLTGNVQAQQLAAALKGGDYVGPAGSPLRTIAESAGQAPKAFAEPTTTPGSSHLGFWGSVLGAMELGHNLPLEHGGLEAAAIPLAYQGARMGARAYALGPGQKGAVQYAPGQVDPRVLAAALTSSPGIAQQSQR